MSIESGIYNTLKNAAGVAALVGDRIYPGAIPQGERADCIAWSQISGVRSYTCDGAVGLVVARFQFTYWTMLILNRRSGADAVRKAFEVASPGTWDGTSVHSCMMVMESDTQDISEIDALKRYGKVLDFEIAFAETAR